MWLIPAGAGEICLLGTHNLGAGCTTRIVATTRGFFSALQTTAGTTEIQGILPKAATLQVNYANAASSVVRTNPLGAFVVRLGRPAISFTLTTPTGQTVAIPGRCIPCQRQHRPRTTASPHRSNPVQ
jgi:hypothetical protein